MIEMTAAADARFQEAEAPLGWKSPPHSISVGPTPGSGAGLLLRRTPERKSTFEAAPTLSVPVHCNRLLGLQPLGSIHGGRRQPKLGLKSGRYLS